MLRFIKLFIRSIGNNKLFATVNLVGLTVGFFAATVIYLYVLGELTYDQFHKDGDRIYRINQTFIWGDDNPAQFSSTGPGVAFAIHEEVPEVLQTVRVHTPDVTSILVESDNKQRFFKDEWVFAADSNFFDLFSFAFKYGDVHTALSTPNAAVVKSETAIKFFGHEDPMGKTILLNDNKAYIVTGVLEEKQPNSYLDNFDVLVSLSSFERMKSVNDNWMWTMFETYVLLDENASFESVEEKIKALPKKYAITTLGWMGYTYEEYIEAGKKWDLFMQPLMSIHLHSDQVINRLSGTGNLKIVIALIGAAVFLVILSCINFINLSTAQFTTRAKDIALRKILGISELRISSRFIAESIFYCLISLICAFVLLHYFVPIINQSFNISLDFDVLREPQLLFFACSLVLGISVITGLYPFTFFNAFQSVKTLKGELRTGRKGVRIRNGMLIIQYALSFILLICSFTVFDQLRFFINKDLGFSKENVITIENIHWTSSPESFIHELRKVDGVQHVSYCDGVPMLITNGDQFIPDKPEAGSLPLNFAVGDEEYLQTLGLQLLVGRGFDQAFITDSTAVILNETAAESIGWPIDERILNKKISNWSGEYHVIGVVKDFNYWTLYAPIEPFAIFNEASNAQSGRPLTRAALRVEGTSEEIQRITEQIEEKWMDFAANRPLETKILADHYTDSYQQESQFADVLSFFSILTVIIASLGLFGIVVFTIEQKLKEIGVRKVLGASVSGLIILFSKSYLKLLLVAFIVASPAAFLFMENWLSGFNYRIAPNPLIYITSFLILLIISLCISIFHTFRASIMNPSDVLKDE